MERSGPSDKRLEAPRHADHSAEAAWLEAEVAKAIARTDAANARIEGRAEQERAALRGLLLTSQRELAEAAFKHQAAIEWIRAEARAEAARIIADAQTTTDGGPVAATPPTADAG